MIDLGMKDILAQVAEDALRFGAKKKIGEEVGGVGMGRLTVDRNEAHGREILVHPYIVDRTRILELILYVADRHGRFPGSQRLDQIRQTFTQPRFLFCPSFYDFEPLWTKKLFQAEHELKRRHMDARIGQGEFLFPL